MFNWLFGKKKAKQTSNKKPVKQRNKKGAVSSSTIKKDNTRAFADKSKSFQKTYILLNHIQQKKRLERVRSRAKQHPQLVACLLQSWLKKSHKMSHNRTPKPE